MAALGLTLAAEAETMLFAAQQAGRLTSRLLAFSRRQLVRPQVLDLNRSVGEMALMLRVAKAAPQGRRRPPVAGPCRETILVAEDQEEIRRLIRGALSGVGYQVVEACDGIEAVRLAEEASGKIGLLLTDLTMPRMGGWELAQRIRSMKRHEGIKVLFISGYAGDREVLEEAVVAGIESCLPKPFATETLLARVREALDAE